MPGTGVATTGVCCHHVSPDQKLQALVNFQGKLYTFKQFLTLQSKVISKTVLSTKMLTSVPLRSQITLRNLFDNSTLLNVKLTQKITAFLIQACESKWGIGKYRIINLYNIIIQHRKTIVFYCKYTYTFATQKYK